MKHECAANLYSSVCKVSRPLNFWNRSSWSKLNGQSWADIRITRLEYPNASEAFSDVRYYSEMKKVNKRFVNMLYRVVFFHIIYSSWTSCVVRFVNSSIINGLIILNNFRISDCHADQIVFIAYLQRVTYAWD